jgi:hypothetical protein
MGLTRRVFLERLGAVGGYSAVYLGMEASHSLSPRRAPPPRFRDRRPHSLGPVHHILLLAASASVRGAEIPKNALVERDRYSVETVLGRPVRLV